MPEKYADRDCTTVTVGEASIWQPSITATDSSSGPSKVSKTVPDGKTKIRFVAEVTEIFERGNIAWIPCQMPDDTNTGFEFVGAGMGCAASAGYKKDGTLLDENNLGVLVERDVNAGEVVTLEVTNCTTKISPP
jgi:hypothetical protein